MTFRILVGAVLAAIIALVARRARSLSGSGAFAALFIGCAATAAGWSWALLVVVYFASSSALSRMGRAEKERRTATVVEKGGERDATQVLANGLVFALAAIGSLLHPDAPWIALGAGALAASAADTWATEIGTLYGGQPRSILTGQLLTPGTSGGITIAGTTASIAAAALIAAFSLPARTAGDAGVLFLAVFVAGAAASVFDSLLGATFQERRWCPACERETERAIHDCGTSSIHRRGFTSVDNDAVNFLSTVVGGLLATYLAR